LERLVSKQVRVCFARADPEVGSSG
jgi:hypothetical protein